MIPSTLKYSAKFSLFKHLFSECSNTYRRNTSVLPLCSIDRNYNSISANSFQPKLKKYCYNNNSFQKLTEQNYSVATNFISLDEKSDFDSILPILIRDLTDASKSSDTIPEIHEWFSKVLNYNIAGGKNIRGLNVVFSYRQLSNNRSDEDIRLSYILGWCVEMLQSFFLVIDDIQDESEIRRGVPSWYRLEDVGQAFAINDGLLIESGIYKILKLYFQNQPYYLDIIELFHDTTLKTLYGQGLDLMAAKWTLKRDFSKFTQKTYNTIIKYKTAYYTYHLPVALALQMAGIKDETIHSRTKEILLEIGCLFQIQDDYLDIFGNPSRTGKIGTDIQEGKCSWLAINALKLANDQQLDVFYQNFGYFDQSKIDQIKQLYVDLNLPDLYNKYEEEIHDKINSKINGVEGVPHEIFINLLNVLFKRTR